MKIDLNRCGHVATVVAALVAAIALFSQLYDANKLANEAQIENWKKTAVFTIISESTHHGISIPNILGQYEEAISKKFENTILVGTTLSEAELISVILELRKANMVFKSQDGTYKESYTLDNIQAEDTILKMASLSINRSLFDILKTHSCKYTANELSQAVTDKSGVENYLVVALLNGHIGAQSITINRDNKVCLKQDYDSVAQMQDEFKENFNNMAALQTKLEKLQKSFVEFVKERE